MKILCNPVNFSFIMFGHMWPYSDNFTFYNIKYNYIQPSFLFKFSKEKFLKLSGRTLSVRRKINFLKNV